MEDILHSTSFEHAVDCSVALVLLTNALYNNLLFYFYIGPSVNECYINPYSESCLGENVPHR